MTRFLRTLAFVVLLSIALNTIEPSFAASSEAARSVRVLPSSGPHTIRANTLVTFHLHVNGITLDKTHMGKRAVPGHGHIQIYLDRIPSDATTRADMKGIVAVTATTSFSIGFTRSWLRLHAGHRRFLIALAHNDNVLYSGRPAFFSVTVTRPSH